MNGPAGIPSSLGGPVSQPPREQLRQVCQELEGVFLGQLFQAMREGVVDGELLEPSPGEELFRSLLDDHLATEAARRMDRGIGTALYQQLIRRLPPEDPPLSGDSTRTEITTPRRAVDD